MENRLAPSPSQPANSMGSVALLKLLIARHPYTTALFFLVYWIALLMTLGRFLGPVYSSTHMSFLLYEALGESLLVVIVALPIVLLKWGSETGFARGINGRGILICLIPIVFIAGPVLPGVLLIVGQASGFILVTAIILSLLVGLAEEGMFRGIILRSLLSRGIWPAALLSALFFASIHLTNLLAGASWGYTFGQLILAFGTGMLFASLRLRTGSIWPCVLLHAVRDVGGMIYMGINPSLMSVTPSASANIINGVLCLIALLIAFVLLRPSQVRKLNVVYGLVKQPVALLSSNPPQLYPGSTPYPGGASYPPVYPSPYPTYGYQPLSPAPSNNPPQPYPGTISYQEYPSATVPGSQRAPEAPALTPLNDGEHR